MDHISPDHSCSPAAISRLRGLLRACREADRHDELECISAASQLLGADKTGTVEPMLFAGACESAILAIIGRDTPFILSHGGDGSSMATVIAPVGSKYEVEEFTATAATPALALLAAYCDAMCGLAGARHRFGLSSGGACGSLLQ